MSLTTVDSPLSANAIFWGEIAPCDHLLQIYEEDDIFLDSLEAFVAGGIYTGEATIVIATAAHRRGLEGRLRMRGIDYNAAGRRDDLIILDAEETLARFIEDGWPDDDKFRVVVSDLLERARSNERKVRAFGEMVAVLWARGEKAATVRLEHLWQRLCSEQQFSLFCAYPRAGFTDFALKSLDDICTLHSRLVA